MVSCYVFKRKSATVSKNMQKCLFLRKRLNVLLSSRALVSMPVLFVVLRLLRRSELIYFCDLSAVSLDGR